jgi:hypothetical protein
MNEQKRHRIWAVTRDQYRNTSLPFHTLNPKLPHLFEQKTFISPPISNSTGVLLLSCPTKPLETLHNAAGRKTLGNYAPCFFLLPYLAHYTN